MRVLFASTRGLGHFRPLLPLIEACRATGHETLVAGPPSLRPAVEGAGHAFWEFADPPEEELGPVWARVPSLPLDEQNDVVVGEIFGRLDTTAALPRLRAACTDWGPDVVVRESAEFGSALAAELHRIPHVRAGFGLAAVDEQVLRTVASRLDPIRRAVGLRPDPGADRLRDTPYLTPWPASLEHPEWTEHARTLRFRGALPRSASRPPGEPCVYMTFGSTRAGGGQKSPVYEIGAAAAAGLPVRVLLTLGGGTDRPEVPPDVRVEGWVHEPDVLAEASAVVCHGGAGSVLAAVAAGLPLVVVPLFGDQVVNADAIVAAGAGLRAPADVPALRAALADVLADPAYRAAAERIAGEIAAHPPAGAAVDLLAEVALRRTTAA